MIKIPISCNYGSQIYYEPSDVKSFLLQKTNLRKFSLQLSDDYGNIINDHFECVLSLSYVYLQPDQKIIVEEEKEGDDLSLKRFTFYDGILNTSDSGGFLL